MGVESPTQYFVANSDEKDGTSLSVFYAPLNEGFVVPREVLRVKSSDVARNSLWKLITCVLSLEDDGTSTFEPSSIENVRQDLDRFLRTQPPDELFLDEDAPKDITEALQQVQDVLASEAQTTLAKLASRFGPITPTEAQATRPYPGQYL